MVTRVDVTSSSRMASRGGLVTWAKSCVKKSKSGRGSFDKAGTVVSEPMEPMGSSLTWAMWSHDEAQVLFAVAEVLLLTNDGRVARREHGGRVDLVQGSLLLAEPLAVGGALTEGILQLVVVDDPPLFDVDQEHSSRLQAALSLDVGRVDGQHADLAGEDDTAGPW